MSRTLLQDAQRLHASGQTQEAARLYREVLRADPSQVQALYALGLLHFRAGEFAEAEALMARASENQPRLAEAHYMHGCSLQRQNRIEEAFRAFTKAVASRPLFFEALVNRGAALLALNRQDEALVDFRAALAINPGNSGVWSNCGCILQNLHRHEEALVCFDRALALSPDLVEALYNRGAVLLALKRYGEAGRTFERLLAINPELPDVRTQVVFCRLQCCDWKHLAQDRADIAEGVKQGRPVVQPLVNTRLPGTPADHLACARIYSRRWPPAANPLWRGERYRHQKIRVAYISNDFCDHATSWLAAGLFEQHDRARFETIAISLFPNDSSEMRARVRNAFDAFVDAERQSDETAAALMRRLEVDIAVDLMGYAAGCRPGILAQRPAPVQVNYLGYPGTMGVSYLDYIVADPIVIPEEHYAFYTEKIAALPHTYQCNDSKRRIAERTPTREEAGLPPQGFVFCSFNDPSKITPEFFGIWMGLLKQVDGSVLWLLENNADATRHLKSEAQARGVDPARLVFAPYLKLAHHLARHRLADLFLDTLPYGAHTTASDSLWAGLPVVTCLGGAFPGRVAASLLNAVGMPELIAASPEGYAELALSLARDTERLSGVRAKLARNRETEPLFDTARFTRNLEAAFIAMWERYQRGEPPAHLKV
jgi:protein O-GlcNAc transferase